MVTMLTLGGLSAITPPTPESLGGAAALGSQEAQEERSTGVSREPGDEIHLAEREKKVRHQN